MFPHRSGPPLSSKVAANLVDARQQPSGPRIRTVNEPVDNWCGLMLGQARAVVLGLVLATTCDRRLRRAAGSGPAQVTRRREPGQAGRPPRPGETEPCGSPAAIPRPSCPPTDLVWASGWRSTRLASVLGRALPPTSPVRASATDQTTSVVNVTIWSSTCTIW